MPNLSPQRRRRTARPLLLVSALLLIGALYAAVSPATRVSAETSTSQQIAEGKGLFAVSCASCHGLNGEGTSQGPSLVNAGAAAVDFQVGTGRMPMANPAVQAPRKANPFTEEEVAALAAFVGSLGSGPAIPTPEQYDPSGLDAEQIALGGELFRTNCSACHNFGGAGGALPDGKYAPSLIDSSPKHIWEALRTGPQQMPVFGPGAITDSDVRSMIAYLDQLQAEPSAGATFGSLGPVAEGFYAWVIGVGSLVLFAIWIAARGARVR